MNDIFCVVFLTHFFLYFIKNNCERFQESHAQIQDVGEDLEQVEVMQKKFDDFQSDLRANEVRLAEMNDIALQLMSLGQTEAALKIQTQMHVSSFIWENNENARKRLLG